MNEKILIVDDEKGIVRTLSSILEKKGFVVDSSENSEDAMRKIETSVYDLFIFDIKMAHYSGIDLLRRIRELDPSAPVILITGYSSYDTLQEAINLGAYDYIAKPFNNDKLLSIILEALERRYQTPEGKERSALIERAMESVLNKDYELKIKYDRLRRVSEEYRVMFEFSPIPIIIIDEDGKIIRVNRMFVKESGYEKRDVEGKIHMLDLVTEKDKRIVVENHLKRLRGDEVPNTYRISAIRKDGAEVKVDVNAVLIPSTKYTVVALQIVREGEKKKKKEKKSRDKTKVAQEKSVSFIQREVETILLNEIPLPVLVIDMVGETVDYANQKSQEIFGFGEDWMGKPAKALLPNEVVDEVKSAYMKVFTEGYHFVSSLHLKIGDEIRDLKLHMSHLTAGNGDSKILMIVQDFTRETEVQRKLERDYLFLENILNSLDSSIMVIDERWRLVYANHRFFHLTHQRKEDVVGKSIIELVPQRIIEKTDIFRHIPQVIVSGVPVVGIRVDFEKEYRGYPLVVEVDYFPLPLPGGKRHAIVIIKNIGEITYYERMTENAKKELEIANRKLHTMVQEAEKELEKAKEKLVREEKLAVLGQIAGGIAHELKQPLTVMKNAVYLLSTTAKLDKMGKKYLEMIKEEVEYASRIVSHIRDFGREKTPERRPVMVKEIIEDVLTRVEKLEGIEIISEIEEDIPSIYVDPYQLSTALENIVRNAVQAIAGSDKKKGKVTLKAISHDGEVRIEVIDTGPGIHEEVLSKIFNPLFTTKKEGMGLGLALVNDLVEKNGGKVQVKSEYGKGATFIITFPLKESTEHEGEVKKI